MVVTKFMAAVSHLIEGEEIEHFQTKDIKIGNEVEAAKLASNLRGKITFICSPEIVEIDGKQTWISDINWLITKSLKHEKNPRRNKRVLSV